MLYVLSEDELADRVSRATHEEVCRREAEKAHRLQVLAAAIDAQPVEVARPIWDAVRAMIAVPEAGPDP